MKKKNIAYGWVALGVGLLFILIILMSDWMGGQIFTKGSVLMLLILIGGGIRLYTWRNDEKAKKDELGRQIIYRSSSLSYQILTVALFVLWLIDRKLHHPGNEFGNETLFIAVCLSLVLSPIMQMIVARKYR